MTPEELPATPPAPTGAGRRPRPSAPVPEAAPMQTVGLDAFFGRHHAVQDISLTFPERTVTAIIGPSGCGKSTFIRTLNRMHELVPNAYATGEVLLRGRNVYGRGADPVAIRRAIGMVFQRPNPFPTKSIADNIWAGPRFIRMSLRRAQREELLERTLRGAGLWDEVKNRLSAPAGGLSGGQQQRLCIARALAVEPEVLLMDEPCSALDPQSTLRIEELICELKSRLTIVIVTHNMQQAARVSDRTAFFTIENEGEPGRLIETGPTDQDLQPAGQPAHRGLRLRTVRMRRPEARDARARPAAASCSARIGSATSSAVHAAGKPARPATAISTSRTSSGVTPAPRAPRTCQPSWGSARSVAVIAIATIERSRRPRPGRFHRSAKAKAEVSSSRSGLTARHRSTTPSPRCSSARARPRSRRSSPVGSLIAHPPWSVDARAAARPCGRRSGVSRSSMRSR